MSQHAQKLAEAAPSPKRVIQHGPVAKCRPLYGDGDMEDFTAIDEFRNRPNESWRTAQDKWDSILGIPNEKRLTNDKFRYHWKRRCFCWPDELRLS